MYWTHYWKRETWDEMTDLLYRHLDGKLAHAGGKMFDKVKPCDSVYIVNVWDGVLHLGGRIDVERVLDQDAAENYCDWGFDLWENPKHVVMPLHLARRFQPNTIIPVEDVKKIRFHSGKKIKSPKFREKGKLDQQTFRKVRRLTEDSAKLLNKYIK